MPSNTTYTLRMQAFLVLLCMFVSVLMLHTFGMAEKLYWTHWWFDIVVHGLGGLSMGLFVAILFGNRHLCFLVPPLVVVAWEVFEVQFASVDSQVPGYVLDTVTDISVGLIAAYLSLYLYRLLIYRSQRSG